MMFVVCLKSSFNTRMLSCFKQTITNLTDNNRYVYVAYILTSIGGFFSLCSAKHKVTFCEPSHPTTYRGSYIQRYLMFLK